MQEAEKLLVNNSHTHIWRQRLAKQDLLPVCGHAERCHRNAERRVLRYMLNRQAADDRPDRPRPATRLDVEGAMRSSFLYIRDEVAQRLGFNSRGVSPLGFPTRRLSALVRDAGRANVQVLPAPDSVHIFRPGMDGWPGGPVISEAVQIRRLETIELALLLSYCFLQSLVLSGLVVFLFMLA